MYRGGSIVREAMRVAPERPKWSAGLRAAVATAVPYYVSLQAPHPEPAFAALAGFSVIVADKGGAYRLRAASMLALTLSGSCVALLGTLASPYPALGAALVLTVVGFSAFLRLFGAEATSVGVLTSVALVVALAKPAASFGSALEAASFYLAGGAWALFISLVLWPLRPYRPLRLSVARAMRALAEFARAFGGTDARAQRARRVAVAQTRRAIEMARVVLGRSRRGRPGPSVRGRQLLLLLEEVDQLFGALIALDDAIALEPHPVLTSLVEEVARWIAQALEDTAGALEAERALKVVPSAKALRHKVEARADALSEHVVQILLRALERLTTSVELARAIDDPAVRVPSRAREPSELSKNGSFRSLLVDHLTLDSAFFRHALRTGIATALVWLGSHALHVEHGHWATLTCLAILQPYGLPTWAKAVQRVLGTLCGVGIAMVVAAWVEVPLATLLFCLACVAVAMALMPLNYGVYTVLLTPAFVLLAETESGEKVEGARVLLTLLGAGVALVSSRLLFPISERDQFRPLLAEALDTLRELLQVAAAARPDAAKLRAARRKLGVALLNAEASYQRMLAEPLDPQESEALLTILLYAYRLAAGLIALAESEGTLPHAELRARAPALSSALGELRDAVLERALPSPPSEPHAPLPEGAERVDALFEEVDVLRAALRRWHVREQVLHGR